MKTIVCILSIVVTFGAPVNPPQPIVLTIHTVAGVRTVQAKYVDMTFGADALQIEYVSDKIFCDGFEGSSQCYLLLP